MQPKVFISYSHEDGFFVDKLTEMLKAWDMRDWVDSDSNDLRHGAEWRNEIDNAIQESFTVIVVHSPASKLSEYVIYEWAYALAHKIDIVVLKLKEAELPARLNTYHHPLDFSNKDRSLLPWDRLRKCLEDNRQKYHEKPRQEVTQTFVDHILKLLRHDDLDIKRSAAQTLGYIKNPSAIPALLRASKDDSPELRRACIESLGLIGVFSDPVVSTIITGLYDPVYVVRETALYAIKQAGDTALPALIKLLNTVEECVFVEGRPSGRINACLALRDLRKVKSSKALIEVLNDSDPHVRGVAAGCLGMMKAVRAVPYIEPLLEDTARCWWQGYMVEVRGIAYSALYYMGSKKADEVIDRFNQLHPDVVFKEAEGLPEGI